MTTTYAVLLIGDEAPWEAAGPEERARVYGLHGQFAARCEARGHKIVGGAELTHSSTARVVRGALDDVTVTDGPYVETVEQLGGFYLVESDDLEDLTKVCGVISDGDRVEVRACVPSAGA